MKKNIQNHLGISIHMPHTWHDGKQYLGQRDTVISIHMPHTWHDVNTFAFYSAIRKFQSTCHIRGMTITEFFDHLGRVISIHMPHTWHDPTLVCPFFNFIISIHMPHTWHDVCLQPCRARFRISIHMPHTWHDGLPLRLCALRPNFNPHATYVA